MNARLRIYARIEAIAIIDDCVEDAIRHRLRILKTKAKQSSRFRGQPRVQAAGIRQYSVGCRLEHCSCLGFPCNNDAARTVLPIGPLFLVGGTNLNQLKAVLLQGIFQIEFQELMQEGLI